MKIWLGTSGYSFPDWIGDFYPRGCRRLLPYYCRWFPLVELNFSFYRVPTADMLERMAEQAPEQFQFLVKLHQSITHERDAQAIPEFRGAVEALRRRGQLAGVLAQFPQSFQRGSSQEGWVNHLAEHFGEFDLAVEFRHSSWAQPDVEAWLAERRTILVAVDVPDLAGLYPRGLVQNGPTIYLRLHSRHAGNWYLSGADRYDYSYSDGEMLEWIDELNAAAPRTERAWLLFNNCNRAQAAANARRMRELLEKHAPLLQVQPPFVTPEPGTRQGELFD